MKQAKFTNLCKRSPIIMPMHDPEYAKYIPLRNSVLPIKIQCHISRGLNQELQNLPSASSSPLTTKHCDRYMLTVAPIIDLFICLEDCCHVTSTNENSNCRCSKVVNSKLAIAIETEFRRFFCYVPCVKFSVLLEVTTVCETVARESE